MQALINYFTVQGFLEESLKAFLSCIKPRKFKANDFIMAAGQTENYLSFISSGAVRYFVLVDDKETTFDFAFANSFYCAYDSFYDRKPSQLFIQAVTDCELYSISYQNLTELYKQCDTARLLGQLATESLLSKKVKRELDLLTKSPAERYLNLFSQNPKLIEQIPQKFIASYIGVVPETLSRIRKRIS
ncbi:CarD family transcriptional regulator [Solitalea longa]|uniref:CarD family transcriptional regulator n=1 Tax=Solitalea longa TaxID=2079460 RepID=A0A2S4ZXK8_9SPHI|nr:Crp/Fnr family transcriptional regulator [Solitalea longa]POY35094.1 CarD family transcriptional regulator [Solitalea longa]